MPGYCSTDQSPQRAVVLIEEEDSMYVLGILGVRCVLLCPVVCQVCVIGG
jgi:hypothetical protein